MKLDSISEKALSLGVSRTFFVQADMIDVSWEVRTHCLKSLSGKPYRCPKYNKGLMCPTSKSMNKNFESENDLNSARPFNPNAISLDQFAIKIRQYNHYMLIQIDVVLPEVIKNMEPGRDFTFLYHNNNLFREYVVTELWPSEIKLHEIVLALEELSRGMGFENVKGLVGGPCRLCESRLGLHCINRTGKPCPYPESARTSLEAMGINVIKLCEQVGSPIRFPIAGKVTWCGLLCVA